MRRIVIAVTTVLATALLVLTPARPVQAQDAGRVAADIERTGRSLEFDSDGALDAVIDDANANGIGFAWLDSDADAERMALDVVDEFEGRRYHTVLVLTISGVGAWSSTLDDAMVLDAIDASFDDFSLGRTAEGVTSFTRTLTGSPAATATTTGATRAPVDGGVSGSSSGGVGVGTILLILLVGGGGFLLLRSFRKRSRAKQQASVDLEADRAEIREQLKDNADHVLGLGDRVIASGDVELIATYEEASATYQHVSQSIDGATTAAEVDALDNRIDQAQWQFESIEARLDGRPPPPSPSEIEARATAAIPPPPRPPASPPPPAPGGGRPAPRGDDAVMGRSRGRRQPYGRSPSGGSGGLGGVLGGIITNIVLGGGLGGGGSRRTRQRRSTGLGAPMGGGGLGGGVLRPRGSTPRSGAGSRRGSSAGRSFGTRRGGGGGRRF